MGNNTKQDKKNRSLKQKTISSTGWGFLDKGIGFVVQFIIGIILARLLPVSDFGLIGLAMIVVGFGEIFVNLGLGPSLIQKQRITERHIRVVFTISGIAGLALALLVFTGAPLAAVILGNDNVIPIIKALSIIFVIAGLQISSYALLKKELNFRHLFYISFTQSVIYGVITIAFAINGFGVWSLVIGSIVKRVINLIGSYWFTRHSIIPLFAKNELSDLFRFGSGMTISGVFNYFALQGDYFMVGRLLGTNALGLYSKAYALMVKPTTYFVSVISNVLFPTASKIQQDIPRLRKIFLKTMRFVAFTTIPICVIVVIIAPDLIIGLYGEKWYGAILPLQIIGVFGVFRAMYSSAAAFLKAKGWVYQILLTQIIYGLFMLLLVWIGSTLYGLPGASAGAGTSILIMWICVMELNCRAAKVKRLSVLKTLVPGFLLSVCIGVPLIIFKELLTYQLPAYFRLIILVTISFLLALVIPFVLSQKLLSNIPFELLQLTKTYIPNRFQKKYNKLLNYLN